jgi:hypothetical protein
MVQLGQWLVKLGQTCEVIVFFFGRRPSVEVGVVGSVPRETKGHYIPDNRLVCL